MKRFALCLVILFLTSASALSQTSGATCREISVLGPILATAPGDVMIFTATVSGYAETDEVKYEWAVSAGTIESGQGTSRITVRTTAEMANSNVTATVHIPNIAAECNKTVWDTADVAPAPKMKIDEFGTASLGRLKAGIDNFYIELNREPAARGIIAIQRYNGTLQRAKDFLRCLHFQKKDRSRVTFVFTSEPGTQLHSGLYLMEPTIRHTKMRFMLSRMIFPNWKRYSSLLK